MARTQQPSQYQAPRISIVTVLVLIALGLSLVTPIVPPEKSSQHPGPWPNEADFICQVGDVKKVVTVTKVGEAEAGLTILTQARRI